MNWFNGSIPDAIAEVKSCQKVLLVFVVGEDELSRKMTVTYDDPGVSNKLNSQNCVALKLVFNSVPYQQFSQIYPVVVIPSSFFIGRNGLPIEIITGHLEPKDFLEKVDKIFQLNEESNGPRPQSEPQNSSAKSHAAAAAAATSQEEPMESSDEPQSAVHDASENSSQPPAKAEAVVSSSSEVPVESEPDSSMATASTSGMPLEERVQRAKSLIEARRQNKAMEEQEDWVSSRKKDISSLSTTESGSKRRRLEDAEEAIKERIEEQKRREIGKALQQAKQTRQENELREWAQSRAKEKEEERLARERIRQQIAQDRAERAAKYKQEKEFAVQKEEEKARLKEEQEKSARDAAMKSAMARLQFRLPDGSSFTHQFSADSTLGEARNYVIEEIRPSFSNFTLCTTFPRRHFTEANYSETLRDLQLAPSAAILVLPGQTVAVSNSEGSFVSNIIWMIVSPLLAMWRAVVSVFRRGSSSESEGQAPEPEPGPSNTHASSPSTSSASKKSPMQNDGPVTDGPATGVRRRDPQKVYREGNVFRINNRPTDDDENNTWNGNSTQQM